jgi:hypothetical protein
MGHVFEFLSEDVGGIERTRDVMEGDLLGSDGVTDGHFLDVEVAQFLGDGRAMDPL